MTSPTTTISPASIATLPTTLPFYDHEQVKQQLITHKTNHHCVRLLPISQRPKPSFLKKRRMNRSLSMISPLATPPPPTIAATTTTTRAFDNVFITESTNYMKRIKLNEYDDRHHQRYRSMWNIGDSIHDLLDIPLFHLSPKMTSLIVKGKSLHDITTNIVKFVESISAMGDYDSNKARATVHTMDGVIFAVQLFKTANQTDVLIEMERRKGDTIEFHYLVQAMFKVIEADEHEHVPVSLSARESDDTIVIMESFSSRRYADAPPSLSIVTKFHNTMEQICTLLQKDRFDARLLGMKSLIIMTNCDEEECGEETSSNQEITKLAVHSILQNTTESQIARDCIFDAILQCHNEKNECNININSTTEETRLQFEMDYKLKMKKDALEILANCLEFMVRHDSHTLQSMVTSTLEEWTTLLSHLELQTSDSCAKAEVHSSFHAARCIYYLVSCSRELNECEVHSSVCDMITKFQEQELECSHAGLRDMIHGLCQVKSSHKV